MDPISRARINDALRDTLAELLAREVQDPRVADVTVTGVQVTADLAHATVFFTLLGDEEKRQIAQRGLEHVAGFLRREVGSRVRLRTSPQLHFQFDESFDRGQRIETLLREWHDEKRDTLPESQRRDARPGAAAGEGEADV